MIIMDDKYKSFPYEEYKEHNRKLQNEMKKLGLDALLLSTPENIYYSTGYRSWYTSSLFRPVYVLVPQEGDPAIVLRILEKSTVKFTSWTPNIYCWGTPSRNLGKLDAKDPVDAIQKIIKDLAPNTKTIGLEAGDGLQYFWSLSLLKDIIDSLPNISFVDGSKAIQFARMIKTPWEIERIRYVCKVTENAIYDTAKNIIPGISTEKDVSKGIAKRMAEGGVDKISYLTVTSGEMKYTTFNTYATDRVIQEGDLVLVDISGHIDGYASDLTRVFYMGNLAPQSEYLDMATVAYNSVVAGQSNMKPGIKVSDINKIMEGYISNTKYKDYLVHSSGHSIGLNVVEFPTINDDTHTLLEPNMVFAIEQGVYPFKKEEGAEHIYLSFRYEDEVLVTETGAEWITGPGKPLYDMNDLKKM